MKVQVKHACEEGQYKELYGLFFLGLLRVFFYEKK